MTIRSKHNFNKEMKLINKLKDNQNHVCETYLLPINKQLDAARLNNNRRILHRLIPAIIKEYKSKMLLLERNIISKSFKYFVTSE